MKMDGREEESVKKKERKERKGRRRDRKRGKTERRRGAGGESALLCFRGELYTTESAFITNLVN